MPESANVFAFLWPYPAKITAGGATMPAPQRIRITGDAPEHFERELAESAAGEVVPDGPADTVLECTIDPESQPRESYRLKIKPGSWRLSAGDDAGLAYGCNTLLQLAGLLKRSSDWPVVTIDDAPAMQTRAAMVDLGRTVAGLPMLKRLVRVFHLLRYNRLHLRLYDDELCGVKFDGLPFGHDNPHAITLGELKELVAYARRYHIGIMPELESWGHVGAITHHRPDLRGGPGVYAGASFLIGEPTIAIMSQLIEQVVQALDESASVHLGFDEAKWFTDNSVPVGYAPADLLTRYHDILMETGARHGKQLTMEIHADHAGRTVPDAIREQVVVHPWQYWIANRDQIDKAIERYGVDGGGPWMMSVGQSLAQYRGAYMATRYFCQQAHGRKNPRRNLRGATVCMWGWNDWDRLFITYFAGAQYLWNPNPPTPAGSTPDQESCDRFIFPVMHHWQAAFPDARPEALEMDRGPLVFRGFYQWGPDHGKPVSPSAEAAGTFRGHDFVNEHHLLNKPVTDSSGG